LLRLGKRVVPVEDIHAERDRSYRGPRVSGSFGVSEPHDKKEFSSGDSESFRLSSVLVRKLLTGIGSLELVPSKDKAMMNNRTKTLWLPALASLTGTMAWRLVLQRSFPQSQTLLNHAGLPLAYQLLWLTALPLFGALSAYLSRRAGSDRLTGLTAALSPSIVMIPLWIALAIRMSHPSPRQWFGLLCGVLNWIVSPGIALSLGACSLLGTRTKKNLNRCTMNTRTRTFWIPALVSLMASMVCLTISTLGGLESRFVALGWSTYVVYIPWLLSLPLCGAAGAYLSRRAGGKRRASLAAGLFPVIAITSLVGFLTIIGKFVYAKPQWLYFSMAVLFGSILPGMALLFGAAPFAQAREYGSASLTT
jgi:hypothetical protein